MVEEGDGRGSALPDKTKAPPGAVQDLQSGEERRWRLEYQEPFGRCLIATANLSMGDVIYRDNPIITGPKLTSALLCLGCYKTLTDEHYDCSKCTWTLCGPECETEGYHPYECNVFSKANFKLNLADFGDKNPVYECILPLRCLMLREADPSKWSTLQAMESHDEIRQKSDFWDIEQINVCDFLRKQAKVEYSDALMHTICGILDVNCHEVRSNVPGAPDESRVRGLYPLCAMMSHDCTCNTQHTIMDDHSMVVVASRNIAKGQQITGIYTQLLSGTTERRKHLRYCKFFDCVCRRCSDPTELGTFFSALRCTQCGGPVLCKDPLHPNNTADYRCTECGNEVPVGVVSRLTNSVYYELQDADTGDPAALEAIFNKYEKLFHRNHFHLIGLEHSLSQLYGRSPGYLISELSNKQMDRKIECCRHVLAVIDVIDPGISRLRGLTKYELHAPLLMKANKEFQLQHQTRREFVRQLQDVLQLLRDTSYCLQFEPASTHEGQLCQIARQSAGELEQWICTVKQLPENNFLSESRYQINLRQINHDEESDSDCCIEDLSLEALLKKVESY